MNQPQQFSYAEWLYEMDGGDAVYGNIVFWAQQKGWRLPNTQQQAGLRKLQTEEFKS